jgi:hypothetical protein
METSHSDSVPIPESAGQTTDQTDRPAPTRIPKRFEMNYSRPTYKGVVQINYFWMPAAAHLASAKIRIY